jgi:sporulation protein YlmC with PRC-barrel domain
MITQITELFGLSVYTDKAIYVGDVEDVVIDVDNKKLDALAIGNLNPELVDVKGFKGIKIPFRIIKAIGDITEMRVIDRTQLILDITFFLGYDQAARPAERQRQLEESRQFCDGTGDNNVVLLAVFGKVGSLLGSFRQYRYAG